MALVTRLGAKGYYLPKDSLEKIDVERMQRELTVLRKNPMNRGKPHYLYLYSETPSYYIVPRTWGRIRHGREELSQTKIRKYGKIDLEYTGPCRPAQKMMVKACWRGMKTFGGGLLVAGCGTGKTNMAIMLSVQAGLKTLFIAHDTDLLRQFAERVLETTDATSIGRIQRDTVDVDHPYVVATIQSLVRDRGEKNSPEKIFRDFGMVIFDEVHHYASPTFQRVFQKICPKYIFGMSAENERPDGLFPVLLHNIGPILHNEPVPKDTRVWVKRINYHWSDPVEDQALRGHPNIPDYASMNSQVVENSRRNRLILMIIQHYIDLGRDILVLSERREHLERLHATLELREASASCSGLYMGDMSPEDKRISLTKQVVLGTCSKAKEGLDVPNLTVIIFCTSMSSVRQPIGRILRKKQPGCHPIVVDIIDQDNSAYAGQAEKRASYYRHNKYQVDTLSLTEDKESEKYYSNRQLLSDMLERQPRGALFAQDCGGVRSMKDFVTSDDE